MRWPLVGIMLLLSSCGEPLSEQEPELEFTPGPHQVDYHVSWDTEGVLFSDNGFELTNNLGYVGRFDSEKKVWINLLDGGRFVGTFFTCLYMAVCCVQGLRS